MNNRKYSVIVFDLGNVLIPFNYNIAVEKLERIEPKLGKKFMEYYKANYALHRTFERGDLDEEDFINKILLALENKIDKESFYDIYSKIFIADEGVISLLPTLKGKYLLVLLSNTNSIHQKHGWDHYEFIKYFDELILSYKIGALKPEEKIYKAVEAFTKKPPEEHIFIDDIFEYAEAAKKVGWDAIHFTGYDNLIGELKRKKII